MCLDRTRRILQRDCISVARSNNISAVGSYPRELTDHMIENSCALRSCGQRSIMKGLLLVLLSALLAIPCAAETVKATVYISRTE